MKPFRTTWTEFQGDSANSGYAAQRTGGFSDVRWRRRTLSPGGGSPIIDPLDDSIYLTDRIEQLWKYRSLNGAELWVRPVGTNVQWGSTPAIDNAGRVYALFSNLLESVLVCFDRDGNERWRWMPPGPTWSGSNPVTASVLCGSPKVWNLSDGGALIFLTLIYQNFPQNRQWNLLIAFNQDGLVLGNVWYSTTLIFITGGGAAAFGTTCRSRTRAHHPRTWLARSSSSPRTKPVRLLPRNCREINACGSRLAPSSRAPPPIYRS